MTEKPQPSRMNTDSRRAFVARLKALVDDAGGQRAFASRVGVSQSAVNLWLRDSEPRRDNLAAIAKAMAVSLDWLVSGQPYISIDFYNLVKSGGYLNTLGGPDRQIVFDRGLLTLSESEKPNLLALYLPPTAESIIAANDFLIVDRGAGRDFPVAPSAVAEDARFRGASLDIGVLSVVIEKGRVGTPVIRWGRDAKSKKPLIIFERDKQSKSRRFERDDEMAGITILGPVRFRAGLIRPLFGDSAG